MGFTTWEDAEIDEIQVNSVTIEEVFLVRVDPEIPTMQLSVAIEFTVAVTEPNYDTAIWDSEDKRYLVMEDIHREHTQTDTFDVTTTLTLSEGADPAELDGIDTIAFDGVNRDLEVAIRDDDEYR